MKKIKSVAERKSEYAKSDLEEKRERAKAIVNELAGEGRTYSNVLSVLRIATNELGNRRSDEIIKASQ